jgi:hypothetical protein
MDSKNEALALHFKYCALIAIMLLIAVATERWSLSKEFTTYLSNAATMTSLLLGVVAIFYSYISNDGMSRSLGSISTVSAEVREVRTDIQKFADQTKDSAQSAETNTKLVRDASAQLSETMDSLNETLHQLSGQNDVLKGLVSSLPTRLDQLESRFGDVAKAIGEKQKPATGDTSPSALTAEAVDTFLSRASFNQNLFCIACVLAAEKKQSLDIVAFCKAIDWNGATTLTGFLSCMHAVKLCSRTGIEGKDRVFSMKSVHPNLTSRAKEYFVEFLDRSYAEKPDDRAKWTGKISAVEALFAAP